MTPLAGPDLQALLTPHAPYALAVHRPAFTTQNRVLLLVAQTRIALGELVQSNAELLLIWRHDQLVALGRAMLAKQSAGSSLRRPESVLDAAHGPPATFGA
jgi:hypothetical protein